MIQPLPLPGSTQGEARDGWLLGTLAGLALVSAILLTGARMVSPAFALFAVGGVGVAVLTAWRPAVGCAALVLAVPLTAGLGRNTLVPLLRPSEVMTVLVVAGLLLHRLLRPARRPFSAFDIAVASFAVGGVLIPWLVLFLTRADADLNTWRTVLAPAQYLVIYFLFSRAALSGRSLHVVLHLAMVASIVVALVGIAQLADIPGVRAFLAQYYPGAGQAANICQFGVCRPTSLIEHWSSFGAFSVLNYALALALLTTRQPGFPTPWLTAVMAVTAAAVFASITQAAVIGLLLATVVVLWYGRRVPRQVLVAIAGGMLALALFWPQVSARIDQQLSPGAGAASARPESLQVRERYWTEFFLPILGEHVWFGTGTVIPTEVPQSLVNFVDNEYLGFGFRAGLVGEILLGLLLVSVSVVGWRYRRSTDSWNRTVGALGVSYTSVLAVMGTTAEYLTFAGVAQQFWMTVGLLGAARLASTEPRGNPTVALSAGTRLTSRKPQVPAVFYKGLSLLRTSGLIRSSAVVFIGNSIGRFLGLLFSVAAARMLWTGDFGLLAYALVIVNIGTILIINAPTGLARFLARQRGNVTEQNAHFSNWIAFVAATLALSLVLTIPIGRLAGLGGWLLVGLLANLVGVAVFQTYLQVQRGLERYGLMTSFWILANFIQLVGILAAGALGWRDPALFLTIYGLSSVAAFALIQLAVPIPLRLIVALLEPGRIRMILRFTAPLLLTTGFFMVWFGADLVLVQRMLSSTAAGNYAAAKTLASMLVLAPSAIASTLLARVAQLPEGALRKYLLGVLALAAAAILPVLLAAASFSSMLTNLIFGPKYPQAGEPLTLLAVGMAMYGFFLILESTWLGLGWPQFGAVANGIGMACTVAVGLALIPGSGMMGAAAAFTAGSAVQLLVLGAFTLWGVYAGATTRFSHRPEESNGNRRPPDT